MEKLADISVLENLQTQAHERMGLQPMMTSMSVFNELKRSYSRDEMKSVVAASGDDDLAKYKHVRVVADVEKGGYAIYELEDNGWSSRWLYAESIPGKGAAISAADDMERSLAETADEARENRRNSEAFDAAMMGDKDPDRGNYL